MTLQVLSEEDPLSVGLPLLLESWERLKSFGAKTVSRRLDRGWEAWEEQREMARARRHGPAAGETGVSLWAGRPG